jgi:tRNA-binding EMAP/Myf-like protein
MERKLASIRVISDLSPIEGADKIELATIDGWKIVVAKDVGHKVGDKVIYCEIDSFLPIRDEFEFLRKTSYKKMGDQEGFRLKTIRLRGQVSQGLILPLSVLKSTDVVKVKTVSTEWGEQYELFAEDGEPIVEVGDDVTEVLGIVKYEPPIPAELSGKVKGLFPSFLRKTDEERVQNLAKEYESYKLTSEHKFYVTEKLDGSSSTFYLKDGVFGVCSRNLELTESEGNTFWKVARELDLENKMTSLGFNVCLQGELIGEGIQGNPYKIKGQTVRFFNGYNIDTQENIPFLEFMFITQKLGLQTVPVLDFEFLLPETVNDMLNYAEAKSELNSNFDREGVVVRSYDRRISFKSISNKFLLNEK